MMRTVVAGAAIASVAESAGLLKTTHKMYTVKGMDSTSNKVAVWYPTGTSEQYPFISYSHGNTAGGSKLVGDYDLLLSTMASYGYIIAAHESCDTGCSDLATDLFDPPGFKNMYKEQLKVIDWAKARGADGDSVLSKANFDIGVGIAGHSMGGQATVKAASSLGAGHGIKAAVMHHAYTHVYPAPQVPFLAFTGTLDTIATPGQTQRFYNLEDASPIKGYVNKVGSTHFEPNDVGAAQLGVYSAAWFKIFLDETPQSGGVDFHEMIFGQGSDSLCHGGDGAMSVCEVHDGTPTPFDCSPFECTCQGFVDYYGAEVGKAWGCASPDAKSWSIGQDCDDECHTKGTGCKSTAAHHPGCEVDCTLFGCTCQGFVDYYGAEVDKTWGCASAQAQRWSKNEDCDDECHSKGTGCKSTATSHPGCGSDSLHEEVV